MTITRDANTYSAGSRTYPSTSPTGDTRCRANQSNQSKLSPKQLQGPPSCPNSQLTYWQPKGLPVPPTTAYPTVWCFASTTTSCFSAAQKQCLGWLYNAIFTQLNQIICCVNGAWLCLTSRHYTLSFLSWLSCAMQVVMFFLSGGMASILLLSLSCRDLQA